MNQGVTNINFRYKRIFEYIYIKKAIRTNIRIYSYKKMIRTNIRIYLYQKNDTNEYPNIFVSKKQYERISEYIRIKKMIRIWYERIFVSENIRISEYSPHPGLNLIKTRSTEGLLCTPQDTNLCHLCSIAQNTRSRSPCQSVVFLHLFHFLVLVPFWIVVNGCSSK